MHHISFVSGTTQETTCYDKDYFQMYYFMLHVNSYFCHLFMTSHLGNSIGAYRLVKSKFGVAQFISMGTNNLLLRSKQIILEYFN